MTRADITLIIVSLGLLPFLYLHFWSPQEAGERARIMFGEQVVKEAALNKNQQLSIDGSLGKSVLQIENGRIRFIDSPCTGKFCIHYGWLSHSGEFNACLPNQISVEIIGKQHFDTINF